MLADKRQEHLENRLKRIETMLHKILLKIDKLANNNYTAVTDQKIKFFERHEQRLQKQANLLEEQEKALEKIVAKRRIEDRWFNMIMHECKYKISDRDHLICMKTNKPCNFENCPRRDRINEQI